MAKAVVEQSFPPDLANLIDQLERHCFAPDGSSVSKSTYYDLQMAREEMLRERLRYLEATTVYCEAVAMVEEYQQASSSVSSLNLGGARDIQGIYSQFGLPASLQVYEALEHGLVVAEASQKLRLPLISKDGIVHEKDVEKWSTPFRNSLDSSANTTSEGTSRSYITGYATAISFPATTDESDETIGGVPDRFLGITPIYLNQSQLSPNHHFLETAEYQLSVAQEIENLLSAKCDKVSDAITLVDIDSFAVGPFQAAQLPERVKFIIEEMEREESALRDDLHSADRKVAEYYNVLEQILGVLTRLVKDLKLHHQHQYDELKKIWLCKRCETMNAKLRVLEDLLLRDTYTQDSIPALHKIRMYLVEATEEASNAYNKAVTRLREYQGVDPHFDLIATQYHEVVKKLEGLQWTINQVEMDLKHSVDSP